jgi:hypothetical protein
MNLPINRHPRRQEWRVNRSTTLKEAHLFTLFPTVSKLFSFKPLIMCSVQVMIEQFNGPAVHFSGVQTMATAFERVCEAAERFSMTFPGLMRVIYRLMLSSTGIPAQETLKGHSARGDELELEEELRAFRPTLDPPGQLIFAFFQRPMVEAGLEVGRVVPDVQLLKSLPDGTLGRGIARHMEETGLAPIHFGTRRNQTHDVMHVLLGASVSYPDEAAIQWFLLASRPMPMQAFWALGFLIYTREVRYCWRAFRAGLASRYNPESFPVEQHWTTPLDTLQEQLGLPRNLTALRPSLQNSQTLVPTLSN